MRITTISGFVLLGAPLLLTLGLLAQAPAPGTRIEAQLKTKLDTKTAQVGAPVTAVTTSDVKQDGVKLLPKGTTLSGHVTAVTPAESKKSPAHMTVVFDHAQTKQGQSVALRAAIVSVVTPPPPPAMPMDMGGMAMPPPSPDQDARQQNRPGMDVGAVPPNVPVTGGVIGTSDANITPRTPDGLPLGMTDTNAEIASMARASNGAMIRVRAGTLSSARGDLTINSGTRVILEVAH